MVEVSVEAPPSLVGEDGTSVQGTDAKPVVVPRKEKAPVVESKPVRGKKRMGRPLKVYYPDVEDKDERARLLRVDGTIVCCDHCA